MKTFAMVAAMFRDGNRRKAGSSPKPVRPRLTLENLDRRDLPSSTFVQTNLLSDQPGVAQFVQPTLVGPMGIAVDTVDPVSQSFGFGISNSLSNGAVIAGLGTNTLGRPDLVDLGAGAPTGVTFNATGSTSDFLVTGGATVRPAAFLFANASGQIVAWNPLTGERDDQGNILTFSLTGHVEFTATDAATYFGLDLGKVGTANFLYAADFKGEKIDVLDGQFHKVTLGVNGFESFVDPNKPSGYGPSNIKNLNGKLYVTYALNGTEPTNPIAGNGFVDVFETNGHFDGRLATGGDLNNPYGLALAPAGFGDFGGALLVGNINDGHIHAYNATFGVELGTLNGPDGQPLAITQLHGLAFGAGNGKVGDANTLYFTADLDQGQHGLFGNIALNPNTAPKVSSVVVNGGAAQRSLVTQIQVTFDQHVTLPANPIEAFQLNRQGDGAAVNLTTSVDDFGAGTVVTLNFVGGAVEPLQLSNNPTLADGRYTLTVQSLEIGGPNGALDGDGNGVGDDNFVLVGNPATNKLFRLFGDANGDGFVDALDLGQFRSTFNAGLGNPNYLSFLDANGDGVVDALDLGQFRSRYNLAI